MGDFVLICAVAAEFIFGYFIMKKVDVFLENNRRQISALPDASALRIAFEIPAMAESVTDLLESFSKKHPDCELLLFSGSMSEIEKKLEVKELDCGFILSEPQNLDEYESILVSIKPKSFVSNGIGLPIVPLVTKERTAKIVWRKNGNSREMNCFVRQLNQFFLKKQMTV